MKAIVKQEHAQGLSMMQMPMPVIGIHDVLIKVKKTSICGTDVHIYNWDAWAQKNVPVPLIIGHEFMGEIVELGSHVENLSLGDRVSGEGHIVCNHCRHCLQGQKHLCDAVKGLGYHINGCFAEYVSLPAANVFCLPDFVSDDFGAIFDPFGNAVHTALSYSLLAEDVLITGAGPIGIMTAMIALKAGARSVVITDVNDYRLSLAKKIGATIVNVSKESLQEAQRHLEIEKGFTVGMEVSGNPLALNTLIESMQHGGSVALLGIQPPQTAIDWDQVIFKMLTVKGIYGREIFATWFKMLHLLQAGLDLAPVITHHFSADEYQRGFDAMRMQQCGKVILDWEA